MPSQLAPHSTPPQPLQLQAPTPLRRLGQLVAAAANGVLLWIAHQLLDWGWPSFLTSDFELVLGIVTASLVASILLDLALVVHDGPRFRRLTELVTAAFAMAVALRTWEVFPFDFSRSGTDWEPWLHVALIGLVLATGIAVVVNLVRLLTGDRQEA